MKRTPRARLSELLLHSTALLCISLSLSLSLLISSSFHSVSCVTTLYLGTLCFHFFFYFSRGRSFCSGYFFSFSFFSFLSISFFLFSFSVALLLYLYFLVRTTSILTSLHLWPFFIQSSFLFLLFFSFSPPISHGALWLFHNLSFLSFSLGLLPLFLLYRVLQASFLFIREHLLVDSSYLDNSFLF